MKHVKLEKFKIKNKRTTSILFLVIYTIILSGGIYFATSYDLYEEKKDFNVINGTVEDAGDIYFVYYIDGNISRVMPSQNTGYTLDTEKSSCNNGVIPSWNYSTWNFIGNYQNYSATTNTRTKCTLYFNKTAKMVSSVLGNIEVNSYTPDFSKSACDDSSCESHEKGIFETTDTDGNPTYYYRGSVENNYVKFAGYYWRIIRINSNGSLRMIYDGTSAHDNGESSTDRQYGTSQFNTASSNSMYLGYMYTSKNAHGTGTSSTIKTNADKFYADKLANYTSKLDSTVGFCGDRSTLNTQTGVGTDNNTTYTKSYLRVEESSPTLTCENTNDYYTTNTATTGNKALTYPIGLITVDELMLGGHAGGVFNGSYNHAKITPKSYLVSGTTYWTMSPIGIYQPYSSTGLDAYVFTIYYSGKIDDNLTANSYGLRPVINIRSDVTITGNGTKENSYIII